MPRRADISELSLAGLIRQHRRAAGLTQEELAARTQLSVRMIRNLEAGRTRQPHGDSVRRLAQALRLDDAALQGLAAGACNAAVPREFNGSPPDAVTILPPGGLIGREDFAAEIIAMFRAAPCVITLCGLPGVGKSCVAASVACRLCAEAVYEVWWASCRTTSPTAARPSAARPPVGDAAARVLPHDLRHRLANRPGLLVLDAVEHDGDAARYVAELHAAYPALRILVTSARPVRAGEHRWTVPPLAVPPSEAVTAADLAGVPGVEMFVSRLRQRRPGYRMTDVDAPAVATIVRRLDGHPLALELAARHARIFTPADLLRRYGSDMLGLTGSLRDALEYGVGLLGDEERWVLGELALIAGSWTLPSAAAKVSNAHTLERTLDHLCEMGLVNPAQDGSTMWFRMVSSVRQVMIERAAGRDARRRRAGVAPAAASWARAG
jgi:transcriptional regulator with XRE-family HTH domain